MDTNQRGRIAGGLAGLAAGLSPMNSRTFLLALGVTAVGAWVWFKQPGDPRPQFPWYGIIAASYAGGFLIGRVLWRAVKIAAIVAVLVLGGLALLSRAHVDTSKAQQTVKAGSTWVQDQASRAKDYLLHLLPSGSAAVVGVFAGGRGRRRDSDIGSA
jgi:hypothetical protein